MKKLFIYIPTYNRPDSIRITNSCELRYRESGSETGGKEGVKMSNVRPDPEEVELAQIVVGLDNFATGRRTNLDDVRACVGPE